MCSSLVGGRDIRSIDRLELRGKATDSGGGV